MRSVATFAGGSSKVLSKGFRGCVCSEGGCKGDSVSAAHLLKQLDPTVMQQASLETLAECSELVCLFCRKIIACFKGQVASLTTRKQTKAAAAPSKATQQQQPELPRTTMDGSSSTKPPVAEFPVKFLSVSCSTGADMALTPAHNTHNSNNSAARVYKQGSSASQYSSSGGGIPVGPAVSSGPGDYHSSSNITPWAESDEVSPRDQQAHTVPPTAASLAVAAAASNQQGPLYHDSSSFRQWAAASAAAQSLGEHAHMCVYVYACV